MAGRMQRDSCHGLLNEAPGMQLDLWTSEWVVCGFFGYLVVLSRVQPLAAAARRRVVLVSLVCVALIFLLARLRPSATLEVLREWLPAVYLLQGYWMCGVFFRRPMQGVERRLLAVDAWLFGPRALGRLVARLPRIVCSGFELAYLLAYPLVPVGFAVFLVLGQQGRADDFWTAALIAAFGCYGMLPWIQTRPPRALPMGTPLCSPHPVLRWLNGTVLQRMSVQVNTLPSGHAATSVAVGLAVWSVSTAAGAVLLCVAAGITVGTVLGRYHYAVDSVSGVLVGVLGWWVAFYALGV